MKLARILVERGENTKRNRVVLMDQTTVRHCIVIFHEKLYRYSKRPHAMVYFAQKVKLNQYMLSLLWHFYQDHQFVSDLD